MRRGSRIALTTIGLLILVLIFAVWIRQTIVSRRLEELVAEAGLTWPPQYHTTVIFDERNAATFYNQAFELIESTPGLWTGDKANEQPQESRDEAAAYESFLDKFENNETDNLAPELNALRPWLARNEDAIALLLEAAKLNTCDFPYEADTFFPEPLHLPSMRDAARVLQLAALISAADGDATRAAELSWALLRVGNHLQSDRTFLSSLVRCAIFSMAYSTLMHVSPLESLPADWRARIDEELVLYANLDTWTDLRQEKALSLQLIQSFPTAFSEAPEPEAPTGQPATQSPPGNPFLSVLAAPWLRPNVIKYLELMDEFEKSFRQPYWKARPKLVQWDAEISTLSAFYSPATIGLAGMTGYAKQATIARTRAFAARLGLALAAYKEQTGSYPDDLTALVPDFIDEIPLDPFTGNPFIYRTEGVSFILYSLGPNLTDDGGIYLRGKRNQIEKDDISWRVPR